MKFLNSEQAKVFLEKARMRVGEWGGITPAPDNLEFSLSEGYQAPQSARELFCFSQHVVSWVGKADWQLLKTDFSNSFSADEEVAIRYLICEASEEPIEWGGSFISEGILDARREYERDLRLASTISHFLLFEGHGYILSSKKGKVRMLALQDGYVYFYSCVAELSEAVSTMESYFANPNGSPSWVVEGYILYG